MSYKIRISRQWECSPRGGALVTFSAGEYLVPDEMSDYLAQRCIRSGLGKRVEDAKPKHYGVGPDGPEIFVPPKPGKSKGRAPENKLRAS